ncbi:MAG: hypothetical protein B7X12_09235 [Halothiobacillus sp. 20-53-49]|nr:MAG: hypothetical protein B7X12_09235 [Halothiobacillus sp. 20-53-49]
MPNQKHRSGGVLKRANLRFAKPKTPLRRCFFYFKMSQKPIQAQLMARIGVINLSGINALSLV